MKFKQLEENVYCYQDYINVYIIKNGTTAILIDFGSGKVLNDLSEIGVNQVELILHTHYHRDQCFGDQLAIEKGIKIACSAVEKKLFTNCEQFWKEVTYFDMYIFHPTFFISTKNIPISIEFNPGDVYNWKGMDIKIVSTNGHTMGSISYLIHIGEKTLVFTGDLIYQGGKIINYWDLQYYYNDNGDHGIRWTLESLKSLQFINPDLLLPSHGGVITKPLEDIKLLSERLERSKWVFRTEHSGLYTDYQPPQLLPAVGIKEFPSIYHNGTSYLIFGKNKNCILVDYGGEEPPFGFKIKRLKQKLEHYGIEKIDFIFPSHYHDDHVAGINLIKKNFDTKVYALENIVDILEHPGDYRVGCIANSPIKVDRVLTDREIFEWDGIEFTVYHFPGQTEYHMGLFAKIDGKRIFFIGDSFTHSLVFDRYNNVNCWNYCQLGEGKGYMKCADILMECKPEYLALSHYAIVKVTEDMLFKFKEIVSRYESTIANLVPYDNPNFGFDPNWISFKPIRVISQRGGTFTAELVLRNYSAVPMQCTVQLNLPNGWRAEYNKITTIQSETFGRLPILISIPENEEHGRTIITANIIIDEQDLGPIPDLTVDHGFSPSEKWEGWQVTTGMPLDDWFDVQKEIRYHFFTFPDNPNSIESEGSK